MNQKLKILSDKELKEIMHELPRFKDDYYPNHKLIIDEWDQTTAYVTYANLNDSYWDTSWETSSSNEPMETTTWEFYTTSTT